MNLAGVGDALKKAHTALRDRGDALVLMPALVPGRVVRDGRQVGEIGNREFAARVEIAQRGIADVVNAGLFSLRFAHTFDVREYFVTGQALIDQESPKGAYFAPELASELAHAAEIVLLKSSQVIALRKLDPA